MTTYDRSHHPRNGQGKWVRQIDNAERDAKAAVLAAQGRSYRSIATELDYNNARDAWRGAMKARTELSSMKTLTQIRDEQLLENAELRAVMWETVRNPPQAIDRLGRPVTDTDGNPVPDETARTDAASVIIRAQERLAKLTGCDMPRQTSVSNLSAAERIELAEQLALANGADPAEVYGGSLIHAVAEPT